MSNRDELSKVIAEQVNEWFGPCTCHEDWASRGRLDPDCERCSAVVDGLSEEITAAILASGFPARAFDALLAELDARPTITTTYGNAAHLIRTALDTDKDQP